MASATLREILTGRPAELSFGTSGLRGLVRDLSQLETFINTEGFLRYLLGKGQVRAGDTVWVAADLRPSSTRLVDLPPERGEIVQAVLRGIEESGLKPGYVGLVPTPALVHFALAKRQASVMVTGSHIPFDRNGIKFHTPAGEVLKSEEAAILASVRAVREEVYRQTAEVALFQADGMFKPGERRPLPAPERGAAEGYVRRYVEAFPRGALAGALVLVYQHSAVGRDLLVEILESLGANVVAAGRSEAFISIDTEAVNDAMLADIQRLVDRHGGPAIQAVIATDGDSDRPLLLGVERGMVRFFPGDLLGLVVAEYLRVNHAAVPISANDAIDYQLGRRGVTVVKTRIGSPYVIEAMREVGWEANGGFLTARPIRIPGGGELTALPTRDAVLPILAALYSAFGSGLTLAGRFAQLPSRYGRSGLLRDFPREISDRLLAKFSPAKHRPEWVMFAAQGVRLRNQAGEETALSSSDPLSRELLQCRSQLERFFTAAQGFGPVSWINYLDGVRIGFANGDIAHIRPSGNAPELRLYACAASQARADAIVGAGVTEDGILRRLEFEARAQAAIDAVRATPRILRLEGVIQHYDWGGHEFIPGLLGARQPPGRPCAEYWIGTHPGGPAIAEIGGSCVAFPALVEGAGEALLGSEVLQRFGRQLPYLLKVLDARKMLSIQAHPDLAQAQDGFQRENTKGIPLRAPYRNYRDPNHKPEMQVALSDLWMLHGFRPVEEIAGLWKQKPALRSLAMELLEVIGAPGASRAQQCQALRELYERLMTLPQDEVDHSLNGILPSLESNPSLSREDPDFWVLQASRDFPLPDGHRDRGLFAFYLLNLLHLKPGEATFQGAGVLHAYLQGRIIELMANSDNVLRGGLTPKHVDVDELLRVVRFEPGTPQRITPRKRSETEMLFEAPGAEFTLARIAVETDRVHQRPLGHPPDCLLVLEGNVRVTADQGSISLPRGGALFAPHDLPYRIEAPHDRAVVFRASLPEPEDRV